MLSAGVLAREISTRVREPRLWTAPKIKRHKQLADSDSSDESDTAPGDVSWSDVVRLAPNPAEIANRPISQVEFYPQAARILEVSMQRSSQQCQAAADAFLTDTTRTLHRRLSDLRAMVALDLSSLARAATDQADAVSADLAVEQRLNAKRVVDTIEKMLRRRRRRFRWVRRAGWLAVEWVLVGFMWYVWFLVMIVRIFLGVGNGLVAGVRWLLWL